jgi:hypothetical protein
MIEHLIGRRRFLKGAAGVLGAMATWHWTAALGQTLLAMPHVIVVLPGITGSVLRKDGKDLWAPSAQGILGAILSLGQNLQALKLAQDPSDIDDLEDGVTADRLIPDIHLIPGLWKIDGYTALFKEIERRFAVERGRNLFEFPYDWRRDNRIAARGLARQSHAWLKAWREHSGNEHAGLILIAHSMGGLVSRYFLECLDGWRDTKMLITFGTPYRGSLNALNFLCNGFKKKLGPLTLVDLTELRRSFTSIYQLLPVYPCYDNGDGKLVRVGESTGIPRLDASKAAQALAFHDEIEQQVAVHMKDETYRQKGYRIHPVVGMYQPTLQEARLVAGKVEFLTKLQGNALDGDGTVPRPSATPKELSGLDREFFIAEAHGSLQNSEPALVQLSGLLSGQTLDWKIFMGPGALNIALFLDDIYPSKDPIEIRARYETQGPSLSSKLLVTLRAIVTNLQTGQTIKRPLDRKPDGFHTANVGPLEVGAYRVTIESGSTDSVTDVFVVAKS